MVLESRKYMTQSVDSLRIGDCSLQFVYDSLNSLWFSALLLVLLLLLLLCMVMMTSRRLWRERMWIMLVERMMMVAMMRMILVKVTATDRRRYCYCVVNRSMSLERGLFHLSLVNACLPLQSR